MIKNGLYLVAPHGRLIFTGEKNLIATGRKFPISGERVICSKESGAGLAFGVAVIGDPLIVDSNSFDDRFSEHRVSKAARLKWWEEKPHLYLYPIQYFTPFPEPHEIDILPGTIMDMGEVDFPFDAPPDGEKHLVIMSSSAKIDTKEAEMPWKPSDATGFTKKADTPEKQKLWASTANGRLAECKKGGGSTDECESSAIRVANSAVAEKKEFDELIGIIRTEVQGALEKAMAGAGEDIVEDKAGDDGEGEMHSCTCPNCGATTESDVPCDEAVCPECGGQARSEDKAASSDEDKPKDDDEEEDDEEKDEKAGRRLSRSILDKLRSAYDTISELIGHGEYSDRQSDPSPIEAITAQITPSVKNFKSLGTDSEGRDWFMIWPTNAYKDREGEFFTTKALHDYVERHAEEDVKGIADVAHAPGSEFGTIRHQAVVADHFVCQLGTYDNTLIGQAFKRFFEKHPDGHKKIAPQGWGASHEFTYNHEDRADGVFQVFDIHKSTVLPLHKAANVFNPTPVMGGFKMDKDQQELFDTVGAELGLENLAETVIVMGKNAKAALDDAGAERKSVKAEQVPEEDESQEDEEKKPEKDDSKKEATTVDEIVTAVTERLGLEALSATMESILAENKSLKEEVVTLSTQVGEVKQAKEEEVAQMVGQPRYAWEVFQASKAAETVTDATPALKGMPSVVESLAARQSK